MKKAKATKQPRDGSRGARREGRGLLRRKGPSLRQGRRLTGSRTAVDDPDNPFWTTADFAKARRPEDVLPPKVLAQFPGHRGKQKAPTKIPISIRLSRDVLDHFKRSGPGWQSRIEETLRKAARLKGRSP
jgi:uncharacterized protein (DUF4415 family)